MKDLFRVSTTRPANPSADEVCYWDAPASELGFGEASAPAEPAADATPDRATETDHPAADADATDDTPKGTARAEGREDVDESDDDEDADPLDLLTDRDDDESAKGAKPLEERYKALSKRARKLEKSLKKSAPLQALLREGGIDVRTLLTSHQQLMNLQAQMDRNPRLRALLEGEPDPTDRRDPARAERRPAADEKPLPFDTNDEVGRYMSDFITETRATIARLENENRQFREGTEQRVGRVESTLTNTQRGAVISNWRSVTDAAMKELDKPMQPLFRDAMNAAMHDYIRGGHKLTPQQMVEHYLKGLRISKGQKDRASAAAQQRTATHNTQLPRRPGPGQGTPASPRSRTVPRMEQFNRDIQRKFGAA